jgi:D-glycerate 3-kinase
MTTLRESFVDLLQAENLAVDAMAQNYASVYLPLADWLNQQHQNGMRIIGINGAQGSGKSTLCRLLALLLQQGFNKSVAVLSLDDFYLTREQRRKLTESIHPLLQTRGVPGTHDVDLAIATLKALKNGLPVTLPCFDKSQDDRASESAWPAIRHSADVVLFEGWCVGALPQTAAQLVKPVNSLEAQQDAQGIWRQYVNTKLAGEYQSLFALLDVLLMLKVPSFDKVYDWRALQESKLQQGMDSEQLHYFIMHYERLTRYMLDEMPQRADRVLQIGDDHQIVV